MKRKQTGYYTPISTTGEKAKAFVPNPLPPEPPLEFDSELQALYEKTILAVGRLDGVSTLLPDTNLLLYFYVRREALLSSQIEGTQSSLSDLFIYENGDNLQDIPIDEVLEVSNYVAAMDYGLKKIKKGMPITLNLMKQIHGKLLAKGRGSNMQPGEFRRSQNWIGGSRPGNAKFVPPPHTEVMNCMGELEKFINDQPKKTPTLIKAALMHVQFETIHPFLDGNGRLGRLLITLILCADKVLSQPLLYLSLYFKVNRDQYYKILQNIRKDGDWEKWIKYFLSGVEETSELAVKMAKDINKLFEKDREKINTLGKKTASALKLHSYLQQKPIMLVPNAVKPLGISKVTIYKVLNTLIDLKIVKESDGTKKGQRFIYTKYLDLLSEGTEPIK